MNADIPGAAIPEQMNEGDDIYKPEGRIVLKIEKLSEFAYGDGNSQRLSDAVHIRGLPWKILATSSYGRWLKRLSRRGNQTTYRQKCLSYYLQCNADNADADWSCNVSVTLRIIAQKEEKEDHVQEFAYIFNDERNEWGIREFMTFEKLMDPENGWYNEENDSVILSVDVTADAPRGVKTTSASLADRMLYFLNSGKMYDVHFLVNLEEGQKEQFAAHKAILATFSAVFDRMFDFDSNRGNSDKVIEVTDVKPEAFRVMLNFIYTTDLGGLNQDNVFDVLHAANKYDIADLVDACADYYPSLDVNNVLYALGKAWLYGEKRMISRCWHVIDINACAVLENDQFVEIDQALLCKMFARDQLILRTGEITIWNAALRWADAQCHKHDLEVTGDNRRKMLGPALYNIRFPLIPKEQFTSVIVPTKVLTKDEMFNVLLYHANPTDDIPNEYPLDFSSKSRTC